MTHTRYAIYYPPAPGPLADFGARWLGWDIAEGRARAHPALRPLSRPVEEITRTPRKYGFHATVKPPFRLAPGTTSEDLTEAARALCASCAPVTLDGLRLARIGRFLALVPVGDTQALAGLAATMVRDLDRFRAPAEPAELARRRGKGLSERQDALLLQWGYPYVMEEFRFHMTLSGSLSEDLAAETAGVLEAGFESILSGQVKIADLSLVGERPDGCFEIVHRLPLEA